MNIGLRTTRDGRRIEVTTDVAASRSLAWELLTDTRYWPVWGPPVTGVEPEAAVIEEGMTGRIQPLLTAWFPFRIESCVDYRWTWSVCGLTPPADGHRVDNLGTDRCRIALELPLWAPWYIPLCQRALANLESLCDRHIDEYRR
jgi:hypothetical protein